MKFVNGKCFFLENLAKTQTKYLFMAKNDFVQQKKSKPVKLQSKRKKRF